MGERLIIVPLIALTVSCGSDPLPRAPESRIAPSTFAYSGATVFVDDSAYKELDVTFKSNGASTAKTDLVMKRLWDQGRMFGVNSDDWLVKIGRYTINGHRLIRIRFVAGPRKGQMGLILCDSCIYWTKPNEP